MNTLAWMDDLDEDSREFYWHWGIDGSPFSGWWFNANAARYASLAYWFGDYSHGVFIHVRNLFATMVDIYENGVHVLGRPRMKYKCNNNFCSESVMARHGSKRYTQICDNNFFNIFPDPLNTPRWRRSRIWILIHEWFHNIADVNYPRDRCNYDACFRGWRCPPNATDSGHQCYQRSNNAIWNWTFTENPVGTVPAGNFPRNLVAMGSNKQLDDAQWNVDNLVSWAIARWMDGQWGDCDGPRMNTAPQPDRW